MLEAVRQCGLVLQFAQEFCDEEDIVSLAVRQTSLALEFASKRLQKLRGPHIPRQPSHPRRNVNDEQSDRKDCKAHDEAPKGRNCHESDESSS